ncbi:MAG: replicative DNA helicase [Caulobacter sp.]
MTLKSVDLRQKAKAPELPSNIEAEQAVIGAVLFENAAMEACEGITFEDFHEPVHGLLWFVIEKFIAAGKKAEPIGVADGLRDDANFAAYGGLIALADLVDRAPALNAVAHFAAIVRDTAIKRRLAKLASEIVEAAISGASAAEVMEQAERGLAGVSEAQDGGSGFMGLSDALQQAVEMAEDAYERKGGLAGHSTGLIDLDQRLGGLVDGNLIVLAGRPSMGKSSLALNIAWALAKAGKPVGFFSLEMTAAEIGLRLLGDVTGISSDRIRKGQIDAHEYAKLRDAQDMIRSHPLHIDETGGISLSKLTARAKRLKRRYGLALVVVDYLQLITIGRRGSNDGRTQEVSEITMGLKALAKDLNVPVLALSQLSRKVEERTDKRPLLNDLRESGSIEQDADVVLFVYRDAYYLARSEPQPGSHEHLAWIEKMDQVQGMAEVIIGKARHGPIGTVRLSFNEGLTRFGNLAREGRFEPQ